MPSVDVVIPNYQYAHYLRGCVASILAQDVPDLRVLIIDNASTDNSVEVAQELVRADSRVQLVTHARNIGPHASFNEGLDWAEADYFTIMCVDDLAAPGAFARSIAVMERWPDVGLAHGTALRIHGEAPFTGTVPVAGPAGWRIENGRAALRRYFRNGFMPMLCCTTLHRTQVHKRAGYYRASVPHTDDFELWLRVAALADIASTDAIHGIIRFHRNALSSFVCEDVAQDFYLYEEAFASFFGHEGAALPDAGPLRRMAARGLAARAYWSGLSHRARGRRNQAKALLGYVRQRQPAMLLAPPLDYLLLREGALSRLGSGLKELGRRLVTLPALAAPEIGVPQPGSGGDAPAP